MDGQTLTEAVHAHGINVRYIGKVSISVSLKCKFDQFMGNFFKKFCLVLKMVMRFSFSFSFFIFCQWLYWFYMSGSLSQVADGTKHLPHLWDLCSNEIVVRSAKHILKVISTILPASTSHWVWKQLEIFYIVRFIPQSFTIMILQRGVRCYNIVTCDSFLLLVIGSDNYRPVCAWLKQESVLLSLQACTWNFISCPSLPSFSA